MTIQLRLDLCPHFRNPQFWNIEHALGFRWIAASCPGQEVEQAQADGFI